MQRSQEQIVQVVVGNPNVTPIAAEGSKSARLFSLFTVELPLDDFRGLPPEWHFAVLDPTLKVADQIVRDQVVPEARALIAEFPAHKPLVLVSGHDGVHLADEFTMLERNVFPLDSNDFPRGPPKPVQPRLAPFVAACQRKLQTSASDVALSLSPYVRNRPVQGWGFFGRRKALRELVASDENFMIVGARRVGKTSLMQEAARRKEANGEEVYFIDVQHCRSTGDMVGEILRRISPREAANAIRHGQILDEGALSIILRRLAARHQRVTLFLDELGNVISRLSAGDREFLGLLRRNVQHGQLRIAFSCFQEVFLQQAADFEGPAVNFGTVLRLGMFSSSEVDDFVCGPLEFWNPLKEADKAELLKVVNDHVGHHPFLLQHFCYALFRSLVETRGSVAQIAKSLVRRELGDVFAEPVEEVFYRLGSPLLMYLFLRGCHEADRPGIGLRQAKFTRPWIAKVLQELGLPFGTDETRTLLERLDIHALCSAVDNQRSRQAIASPLIYEYVRANEDPVEDYIDALREDVCR